MRKLSAILTLLVTVSLSLRADILLLDSTNEPFYTNGPISGQGQWYTYSPKTNVVHDALWNTSLGLVLVLH